MSCLRRFLIVLSLALLSMQGALAHEHPAFAHHAGGTMGMTGVAGKFDTSQMLSAMSSHCAGMTGTMADAPHDHGRCACCTTACGIHCGALLADFRFEPAKPGSMSPQPRRELRRDSVTYAPPVPPPIG